METFHNRVEDLIEQDPVHSVERAIERAAWETDHPSEAATAAGQCTVCETDAAERIRFGRRDLLCQGCFDLSLDLMAKAVSEVYPELAVAR